MAKEWGAWSGERVDTESYQCGPSEVRWQVFKRIKSQLCFAFHTFPHPGTPLGLAWDCAKSGAKRTTYADVGSGCNSLLEFTAFE